MCTFLQQQRADFDGGGTAGELQSKNHSWLTVGDWPSQHPFYIYSVLWLNRLGYPVWDSENDAEFKSTMTMRFTPQRTRPDHSSWKRDAARTLVGGAVIVYMCSYFDFHVYVFVPTPLIFSKLCTSCPHLEVKKMAWIIKENDSQKNKKMHQNMSLLLFHHHTTVVC